MCVSLFAALATLELFEKQHLGKLLRDGVERVGFSRVDTEQSSSPPPHVPHSDTDSLTTPLCQWGEFREGVGGGGHQEKGDYTVT